MIDFLPQHVAVLDAEGFLLQANQVMLDYFGRTLEEMQGAGTVERIKRDVHPDDLDRVRIERQTGFSKGAPFEIEWRLLGKDGRPYKWIGVWRDGSKDADARTTAVLEQALALLRGAGAELVDPVELPGAAEINEPEFAALSDERSPDGAPRSGV